MNRRQPETHPFFKGLNPHHLVLNAVAFARNMDPVLEMLNAAAEGIEDRWQSAAEAYYFLQEIAKEWGDEP